MRVLVRRPSLRLAEGLVTHIERRQVDVDLALVQWERYVATLRDAGWETIEVPEAPDCPDSVFVEDTVIAFKHLAVIARPGAIVRRAETLGAEPVVASLGYSIQRIQAPGTLDGGDVLKVGDTLYVGRSGRTNDEGIRQLRTIVEACGGSVVAVSVTKALHLKSAVTALPDGTIIGWQPVVDDPASFPRFLAAPEESGAHVVRLGGNRLLLAADCPRSAELYAGLGYTPVLVDISEYQKLEGCVTCLSVRLRGDPKRAAAC